MPTAGRTIARARRFRPSNRTCLAWRRADQLLRTNCSFLATIKARVLLQQVVSFKISVMAALQKFPPRRGAAVISPGFSEVAAPTRFTTPQPRLARAVAHRERSKPSVDKH